MPVRLRHPVVDVCDVAAGGEAAAARSGSYENGSRCAGRCHPHGSGLWTGRNGPHREGGRVGSLSPGRDVRVTDMSAWGQHDRGNSATRSQLGRDGRGVPTAGSHEATARSRRNDVSEVPDTVPALSTPSHAQVDAMAHPRRAASVTASSIGNGLPNSDRLTPAEACLLTTRIRILLLPVVQATDRCACGAAEPDTRNQPKKSSTLSVGRTEPSPHRTRNAEPGARVT